jgi:transcriptional regulator with XRE-family HTH domain
MSANEGQRQLAALGKSLPEIARVCGVSKQAVSGWKQGKKVPGPAQRRALLTEYGIPVKAWDLRVGSPSKVTTKTATPAPTPAVDPEASTDQRIDRVAQLEDLLNDIRTARKTKGLAAGELARLAGQESQIVERIARLEDQRRATAALLEARIVRESPYWRKLRDALFTALKKHKSAAKDVLAVVTEFEEAS